MREWRPKKPSNPEKPDFSLRIESHPDTKLLQTLQLNENDSILILELGNHLYAQKKTKYHRSAPILIQDPKLCERIRNKQVLPTHVATLFSNPPVSRHVDILLDEQRSNPLSGTVSHSLDVTHRLQQAMSHFIENNPDTASALNLQPPAQNIFAPSTPLAAYEAHRSLHSNAKTTPQTPLHKLTQPVVLKALQQASENQQAHLAKAQQLKKKLETHSRQLEKILAELPSLEAQLNQLSQQISDLSTHLNVKHLNHDQLLQKTGKELADMQAQLEASLTEALSLHNILEIYSPDSHHYSTSLAQLKALIREIVEQRHQVNYFIQQQAFRELEEARLKHLFTRRQELEEAISELRTAIEHLERINQEILQDDPLAVPEPVPALAIHELNRLETELYIINSDPALKMKE